jgi:hypothetical protein
MLQTGLLWNRESHSAWSVAHGVTTFFFPKLELPVEVFKELRIQMTLNLGIKAISSGLYWGAYRKQAI